MRALEMIAPGTALREGIDSILHARTGGLIVIGEPEDLSFLNSGGIKLDIDYTPAFLYQLAKMDGAIILNANATKVTMANVQLMPDPTILSPPGASAIAIAAPAVPRRCLRAADMRWSAAAPRAARNSFRGSIRRSSCS